MEYVPVELNTLLARADFKIEIFNNLIKQKGYTVIWQQGMFCSCISTDSGQPDYNCPTCYGKGYVYFDPVKTKALISSIGGGKDFEAIGQHEKGKAYLTPLSTDNVGYRDRFVLPDFIIKYSQVINKTLGVNKTRYPIIDIIACRVLDTLYKRKIDFDISEDTSGIEWYEDVPGIPTDGTSYSVLYNTHPAYIAVNPIHEIRGTYTYHRGQGIEQFAPLPKQFQIKREDFLVNGEL